jgi:hypothetical protein
VTDIAIFARGGSKSIKCTRRAYGKLDHLSQA